MGDAVQVVSVQEIDQACGRVQAMGPAEMEMLADDFHAHQPVLMDALVVFRLVYADPNVSGRLMLIGLSLWVAFRRYPVVREHAVDDALFDRLSDRNIAFLKYLDGETDAEEFARLVQRDVDGYRQGPALAFLLAEITWNRSGALDMSFEDRSRALLTVKGVLDCLDAVLNGAP